MPRHQTVADPIQFLLLIELSFLFTITILVFSFYIPSFSMLFPFLYFL